MDGPTGLDILVHRGLGEYFDAPPAPLSRLRSGLHRIEFVGDEDLTAPGDSLNLPVLLPVTSEFQADGLRAVRIRHPLSLLIAVTNDVLGLRTYYAIRAGANFVLNLAIPGESQIDMVCAQIRAHNMATSAWAALPASAAPAAETRLRAVPVGGDGRRLPGYPPMAGPSLPEHDPELVRLLCTSMTVTEISRHYYCSERSMYRRIRKLYDALGVGSRAELRSAATRLGLNRQSRARVR